MAKAQQTPLSSVFDDLVAQNKKRFDDLYARGRSKAVGPAITATAPIGRKTLSAPSLAGAPAIQLEPDSAAARRLNQRFGNDWRYQIAAQQRRGDEAIVLCKLIFGKEGAVRTQFGRAKISGAAVVGASDGVRFQLDTDGAGERDAYRRATEAALMNCIDLI